MVDTIAHNTATQSDSQADAWTDATYRADMLAEYLAAEKDKHPSTSEDEPQQIDEQKVSSSCTCSLSAQSASNKQVTLHHRKSKFYVRIAIGLTVAFLLGMPAVAFTLSESDYAQGMDLVFGRALRLFTQQVFRRYGKFPYCWIEHLQGDKLRLNRHFIGYNVPFMDAKYLEVVWQTFYASKLTGLEKIYYPKGLAFYLAKYMGKGEKFTRARFSQDWIFRGWWKVSKQFYAEYKRYPTAEELAHLAGSQHLQSDLDYFLNMGELEA